MRCSNFAVHTFIPEGIFSNNIVGYSDDVIYTH
jgi:hypothetical protein